MGKVILEVRNLKTKYVTRFREDVYAVDGVSFTNEGAIKAMTMWQAAGGVLILGFTLWNELDTAN